MYHIESFLSARLFLRPQLAGDRIYFISNLSGHLSLYSMRYGGSVPQPLLPPQIALQNPHLLEHSESFLVFPQLDKIIVLIDKDGDENYQPMWIPMEGGYPAPTFKDYFADYRVRLQDCDHDRGLVFLIAESRKSQMKSAYLGSLATGELVMLGESPWSGLPPKANQDLSKIILIDRYAYGDTVLYLWTKERGARELLYGTPLEQRKPGQEITLPSIRDAQFVADDQALLFITSLYDDRYGLGYLNIPNPRQIKPVKIKGTVHKGTGELLSLSRIDDYHFRMEYNIDGCSWLYQATFDDQTLEMKLERVICGEGEISNGMLEATSYDRHSNRFILSYSTATSPTQIYTMEGQDRSKVVRHTDERILSIKKELLSTGEDASYTSFDGMRISARLYLPATDLGFTGPRPVVYYIHGGPQSQERPDFAWFSMPIIQFLILNGFAVFVPNVRGSTGYGLSYMKHVDNDWGGKDRLDHVYAVQEFLPQDKRLDCTKIGVVGRSYGGYMTLMQVGQHSDLWSAAIDLFGPYDLITFSERIPETWKPYYKIILGDPEIPAEREFLIARSPRTYIENLACPLMVIQGKNDPRVVERESHDLVEHLRSIGKQVEYLVFDNEGHDVLKFENRVRCYNAMTDFFKAHLMG